MSLRRTGRASADVATGRGDLSLPRANALRGLISTAYPAGVFGGAELLHADIYVNVLNLLFYSSLILSF
ncbi:hypothetical protein M3210_02615 [Oceanobacillus luteolus]|uniref:Uncharacterized protein n=1 Tax=Oceanobacillus luteolus TaxID=1274358 RepID=A0ABW4HR57_9BACI|nr:hypothetical protein [Oceanobacillus luteolus]MCM3739155.1 hypothetical protein [Oceanobacillus luteolus]